MSLGTISPGNSFILTVNVSFPMSLQFRTLILPLQPLTSPSQYTIVEQSGEFAITTGEDGTQTFQLVAPPVGPGGTYFFAVQAPTTLADAGAVIDVSVTYTFVIVDTGEVVSEIFSLTIMIDICIHGSSMITLPNNQLIEIFKLQPNQLILAADGQHTNIIEAVPCWTRNDQCGDCIIFEKDSLGVGIPSDRFAVDAGHPICPPDSYNLNSQACLMPAKYFVNNRDIYIVKWEDVKNLLPGENKRYDIIMKEDSCKAYIANGMIVKARESRKVPGYCYI